MYNNSFYETSVGPKNEKRQKTLYVIFRIFKIIFIAISILLGMLALFIDNSFWFLTAFAVISAILFFLVQRTFYNFYDYIFVEDDVRIIKVRNNIRRKKVLTFGVKQIEKIGLLGGDTIQTYLSQKNLKKIYCTSNSLTDDDVYFIVNLDKKYILLLQYDETFLTNILKVGGVKLLDKEFLEKLKK